MAVLKDEDKGKVKQFFSHVTHPVKLIMFTQEFECSYCEMTHDLVEELAGLSDLVTAEIYDLLKDEAVAKQYGIDKIPATVVMGEKDYGIRFYGVPAGYEFMSLIEDIIDVGKRDPGLPADILKQLARIDKPVHMQAMVTPTCPYCPRAVRTAHRFAMASDFVRGDMVEVTEFPELGTRYNVQGVPNTIINERESVLGAQPEQEFLTAMMKAIGHGV